MPPFSASDHITLLAFDFGTQKIGLAVGQTVTLTTTALPEIKATNGQPNWDQLADIINEWQPDGFVVGLPLLMDGSEFDMTQRARKFANRLHGRFGKPCFTMDERLSSFEARETARQTRQRQERVDSIAASLILQTWFAEYWPPDIDHEQGRLI